MRVGRVAMIIGAALTALAFGLAGTARPAGAAGTRGILVSLFARSDIGPLVTVALTDPSGHDNSPLCSRGAQVNPEYDDWVCGAMPDVDHTLTVGAPADITVSISCWSEHAGSQPVGDTRTTALPAAWGNTSCMVFAWPSNTTGYPPATTIYAYYSVPDGSGLVPTMVDDGGTAIDDACTLHPDAAWIECTPTAYGTYAFVFPGASGSDAISASCRTTSSNPSEYFSLTDGPAVQVTPGSQRIDCQIGLGLPPDSTNPGTPPPTADPNTTDPNTTEPNTADPNATGPVGTGGTGDTTAATATTSTIVMSGASPTTLPPSRVLPATGARGSIERGLPLAALLAVIGTVLIAITRRRVR